LGIVDPEEQIRNLLQSGDLRAAAATTVATFGPEVLGFLGAVLREEEDANEVFSQACEDLWHGIGQFQAKSTIRAWFYSVARHAASRLHRSPHTRRQSNLPLSEAREVAERVRSQTEPHLLTATKDWFSEIRQTLPEDDRILLVLRIDREMSWNDIARVFSPDDDSAENLGRLAARLRKRFQLVKEEIRTRAREAGLLAEDS
jgi:RNA polymerase sigma-70 factor (ECF subfamily)